MIEQKSLDTAKVVFKGEPIPITKKSSEYASEAEFWTNHFVMIISNILAFRSPLTNTTKKYKPVQIFSV